jgi:uncharacterized protein (DUF2062 family)
MPRRFIKRYLPDHGTLREHPHLQRFGARLHDANLWHLNRHSVSGAVALGLFWAFVPMPLQMLPAAACAIWLRVNLPISVALVWITNPLTMPPIWYATYRLGAWLLGMPRQVIPFELTIPNLVARLQDIWEPLYLGSLVAGTVLALLGFVLVRLAWRIYVVQQRRADLERYRQRRTEDDDRD